MFKHKPLVICGHPRSGSHFLFNSIRLNSKNFDFPVSSKDFFYSSIEHILLPGDEKIAKEWIKWFKKVEKDKKNPILRTNCLPEDLIAFVKIFPKNKLQVKIIDYILKKGIFVYIDRKPFDTFLSWYKYAKSGGVITMNAASMRLQTTSLDKFHLIPNLTKLPHRDFKKYDLRTIDLLANHNTLWKMFMRKEKNGYYLTYENLKHHYQITLKKLFIFLDKNFKHQNKKDKFLKVSSQKEAQSNKKVLKLLKYTPFKSLKEKILQKAYGSPSPLLKYEKVSYKNYKNTFIKIYKSSYKIKKGEK